MIGPRLNWLGYVAAMLRCASGLATVEFALCLPVILTLGMYGTEIANLATSYAQISQLALSVADNASRLGQTDNSGVTPTITETDVNSIMFGALKQGASIDFQTKGRIILSSLEKDSITGKQYIHWQRCRGNLAKTSAYGNDTINNGLVGAALAGMGPAAHKITAPTGMAVMYAEVYYNYTGLFGSLFVQNRQIRQEAAFLIRDDRNLIPGITGTGSQSVCN
jgi:Flp pilus assembly protein TadG